MEDSIRLMIEDARYIMMNTKLDDMNAKHMDSLIQRLELLLKEELEIEDNNTRMNKINDS